MSDGSTPTGRNGEPQPWWNQGQPGQGQPHHGQPPQGQQPTGQQPPQGQPQGQQPTGQQPPQGQPQGQPGQPPYGQPGQGQPGQGAPYGQQPRMPGAPTQGQHAAQPGAAPQRPGAPTQQYPVRPGAGAAPTASFGAPGGGTGVQNPPSAAQGFPAAGTQRYPVQYAAGPGQQHTGAPVAGYPQYGAQPERKKKRFSWGSAVTGVLVGGAIGAVVALAVSGQFIRPVFAGSSVEDGVASVLEEEYGLPEVRDVTCPEEPSASAGAEFACSFATGDREFSVQIRVLDSGGQYLVGAVSDGK